MACSVPAGISMNASLTAFRYFNRPPQSCCSVWLWPHWSIYRKKTWYSAGAGIWKCKYAGYLHRICYVSVFPGARHSCDKVLGWTGIVYTYASSGWENGNILASALCLLYMCGRWRNDTGCTYQKGETLLVPEGMGMLKFEGIMDVFLASYRNEED